MIDLDEGLSQVVCFVLIILGGAVVLLSFVGGVAWILKHLMR